MTITAHTASAAIIIFLTQNLPWKRWVLITFAVFSAFVSHFMLDFLPHWSEHYPTRIDLTMLPIMLDASLALSLWWFYFGIRFGWRAWTGSYALVGAASLVPDIKYGMAYIFNFNHDWFDHFHENIQLFENINFVIGLFPQVVIVITAFVLSRNKRGTL